MTSAVFTRKVRRAKRIARPGPMLEEEIHARVVQALRQADVAFFHCPNEGKLPVQYRTKLKRLGVSSGVPDLIIVTPPPCGGYVAAALEIKRKGGRLADTQRAWLQTMASCEWAVACEYGLEACLARLKEWGYL